MNPPSAAPERIGLGRLQNAFGVLLKEGSSFVINIHHLRLMGAFIIVVIRMLYIYFGTDDYTKNLQVKALLKRLALPKVQFEAGEDLEIQNLLGGDLFGGAKAFIFNNMLTQAAADDRIQSLVSSANHFIFLEDSLDKRTTLVKKILTDATVTTKEFTAPEGSQLIDWVVKRAAGLGGTVSKSAATVLLKQLNIALGTTGFSFAGTPASLSLLDQELQKLLTFAGSRAVSPEDVLLLTPQTIEATGFEIVNALGEKNRNKVFSLCERYFHETGGADEKAKLIQLNSLLADQFRSLLIVQSYLAQKVPDAVILEQTGWKSGRLFVLKKIAAKFEGRLLTELLYKLESLDVELKTKSTPPHVLIDLILAQAV